MENRQNEKKNEPFKTNQDLKGFTPRDGEVAKMLKKYGHTMTLVIYIGEYDNAPAIGVKVAGSDPRAKEAAQGLGEVFIEYLQKKLNSYFNEKLNGGINESE